MKLEQTSSVYWWAGQDANRVVSRSSLLHSTVLGRIKLQMWSSMTAGEVLQHP